MNNTKKWAVGVWLAMLAQWAGAAPQPYRIEDTPSWVIESPDAPLLAAEKPVEAGQSDYPLVDHQVRLADETTSYRRVAQRLLTQSAVDESAQISINIDPEREVILLHQVRVFRHGRAIDKLADSRRSLLSREQDLEQGIINGRVTLHILLQDVRVGDVLDWSYSTVRTDPPDQRQYSDWFSTQWSSPARHFRLRILRPASRPLRVLDLSKLPAPKEVRRGEWIDTTWEGRDIAALPDEPARPHWNMRYPRIEFSEFSGWGAVRAWALPRYAVPAARDPAFDALVAEIRAEPDAPARALRALRFVQDDIRYTGLEIGAGAWFPAPPAQVLARRYGDCKDKTLLLVALLRAMNIDAWPALVHSAMGRAVRERLPNIDVFDHAIAKVRLGARDYWLDATVSGQGGTLDTLVQADFGPALVLAPATTELEDMPAREGRTPSSSVTETYDFRKGTSDTAAFDVHTVYRDEDADGMRVKMRSQTVTELGKNYLDYYHRSYDGVRQLRPPKITDDRTRNQFEIDESYTIDKPFDTSGTAPKFYLEAYLISERTRKPDQTLRTTPLARNFPMHVHHEVVAYLPGEWTIRDDDVHIVDKAFEYQSTARLRDGRLDLDYDLRNTRDHVPAAELGEFLSRLAKVHDDAYFTLTDRHHVPAAAAADTPVATPRASQALNIVFVIGFAAGLGFGIWLARHFWKLDLPPGAPEPGAPQGVGGWMAVVAFQVVIGPPVLVYVAYDWTHHVGRDAIFQALPQACQYLVFGLVVLTAAMFVMSLAQLVLLVLRRNSFPRLFVLLKLGWLALYLLVLGALITSHASDNAIEAQIRTLASAVLACAIWIPYILNSQRVRATFTGKPDSGQGYRRTRIPRVLGADTAPAPLPEGS